MAPSAIAMTIVPSTAADMSADTMNTQVMHSALQHEIISVDPAAPESGVLDAIVIAVALDLEIVTARSQTMDIVPSDAAIPLLIEVAATTGHAYARIPVDATWIHRYTMVDGTEVSTVPSGTWNHIVVAVEVIAITRMLMLTTAISRVCQSR